MTIQVVAWTVQRVPCALDGVSLLPTLCLSVFVGIETTRGCTVGDGESSKASTVLSIGLHPSAVDYSRHPGLDEASLAARIEAGEAALRAAGFDVVSCQVPAAPDEAEAQVRGGAAAGSFRVAMIGAGVRMAAEHTLLFERLVNVLNEIQPGIKFCFNTSPETTIDALRRWVQPEQPG
jgi:hypothetical protein